MILLNFLRKLIKDDGFELVDANSKSYIIGKPKKEIPIRLKILDKSLHWKLLINPDLIITQGLCEVCSISENVVQATLKNNLCTLTNNLSLIC